jgi:glycosyltransferase involved in cell wall biosynthesis
VSDTPDVTVVIPTKDRPRAVVRAIASAFAQQDVSVEVIVVDDGSTVPAAQAMESITVPARHTLRVIRHAAPRGVSAARNAGIEAASARWIGFCDDDDIWAPTKAHAQLTAAGSEAVWSCSSVMKVDEDLQPIREAHVPDPATVGDWLLAVNVVPGGASSVIARTAIVRELGGFDTELSTLADWDFWIRLAGCGALAVVDRPLVAYLVQDDSMSMDTRLLKCDMKTFLVKHARERADRRVTMDKGNWRRYVAEMDLRGGRRFKAAGGYLWAARHGRTRAWNLVLASLVAPRWTASVLRARRRAKLSPGWALEVEAWLGPLRTEPTSVSEALI